MTFAFQQFYCKSLQTSVYILGSLLELITTWWFGNFFFEIWRIWAIFSMENPLYRSKSYFRSILPQKKHCYKHALWFGLRQGNLQSAGYTPEERASFARNFLEKGFVDTFRNQHPNAVGYTYWGYRSGARPKNQGKYLITNFSRKSHRTISWCIVLCVMTKRNILMDVTWCCHCMTHWFVWLISLGFLLYLLSVTENRGKLIYLQGTSLSEGCLLLMVHFPWSAVWNLVVTWQVGGWTISLSQKYSQIVFTIHTSFLMSMGVITAPLDLS